MEPGHEHYNVIIVGAGMHGLCAAHTFLSIDPSLAILIVDNNSTVGGVWAKKQLYPSLRANNLQGYYEFSDFPILDTGLESLGVGKRGILSGEALYAYIYKYTEHFDLLRRTRLDTRVVRATNHGSDPVNAWTLELGGAVESIVTCTKLIVATGQASQPLIPSFPGQETFTKPIIHSAKLGDVGRSLISNASVSHITVLGGSKSAHDAVYMFLRAGKRVTWLTRRTGRGAIPMAKTHTQMGPWSVWLEGLLITRSLS